MKMRVNLLFVLALSVFMHSISTVHAEDIDVAAKVSELSANIEHDSADLNLLSEQIDQIDESERDALRFRRDGRTFNLITALNALAREISKLPAESAERLAGGEFLNKEIRILGVAVVNRLKELEKYINTANVELTSLSGGARISKEIYIHSLERMRFRYYEVMVKHLANRESLGLSSKPLRDKLEYMLYLHAEKLAGQVESTTASLAGLQTQQDSDSDNADINTALKDLAFRHKVVASRLETIIELLDKMGADNTQYKAVLIKGSDEFSVDLLDLNVIKKVLADWVASVGAKLATNSPDIIFKFLVFILIIVVFKFLSRLTKRVVEKSCENSSLDLSTLLKDLLISGSGGTVMVLGIFMALSQIGISLGPMLAGLGVAGFVIGFALQDTLGNFAAGAMILIYRPYDVDDFVEVTGASGLVKKMNLVSTTIVTFDNQTLVVPNSKIWGDVIKNVTAQKIRRVDLEFGIGYGDDIEQTEQVLRDIVDSHELVLEKPEPMIKLHALADSSVNFVVRPWVKTENYWVVYWDIMREVKMRFDREGISIPFPQQDVHIYTEGPAGNDAHGLADSDAMARLGGDTEGPTDSDIEALADS